MDGTGVFTTSFKIPDDPVIDAYSDNAGNVVVAYRNFQFWTYRLNLNPVFFNKLVSLNNLKLNSVIASVFYKNVLILSVRDSVDFQKPLLIKYNQ